MAASAVGDGARTIVDLGIGTGALASRCLKRLPRVRLIGVDADAEMLALARRRLGRTVKLVCRDFVRAPLPPTDAVVASLALHHVRTRAGKRRLYRRVFSALRPRGVFVTADCHPATDRTAAMAQRRAWWSHLRKSYSATRTSSLFRSWAREDVYVPLSIEVELLQDSGFTVETLWRRGSFAVLMGTVKAGTQ